MRRGECGRGGGAGGCRTVIRFRFDGPGNEFVNGGVLPAADSVVR
jgi:hypothetical protein